MIPLAIILILLALLIFILAWRGWVVARGQFCKKCRFDLAGLDLDSLDVRCPECGRQVHNEAARREILRRSSRLGLVVAGALLLASAGILWFGVSGKGGMVLGMFPDSTVFWLNDLGVDEALDEVVVRVSRTSQRMDDAYLVRAIEDALAHQADLEQVWDPRWGEVLSVMFGNPLMTDEQMLQYLRNGMDIGAVIRDRVHQGSGSVSMNQTMAYGRISALNFNNSTGSMYTVKTTSGGVVGEEPRLMEINGGMTTNLFIPNRMNAMSMSTNGKVEPTGIGFDVEPGTSVLVFVEYELSLRGVGVVGTYRTEQSVLVVDQDEAIVPILNDPTMAQAFCESIVISPVRVLEEIPEQADNYGLTVLAFQAKYDGLPASIALNAFIDLGDGELVKIGKLVQQGPSETKGARVNWGMKPFETRDSTPYAEAIARMIELGQVDVVFMTDATLADGSPGISEVLNLSLRFEDIPVAVFAEKDSIRFISYTPSNKSYKADDPKIWYEGICGSEE